MMMMMMTVVSHCNSLVSKQGLKCCSPEDYFSDTGVGCSNWGLCWLLLFSARLLSSVLLADRSFRVCWFIISNDAKLCKLQGDLPLSYFVTSPDMRVQLEQQRRKVWSEVRNCYRSLFLAVAESGQIFWMQSVGLAPSSVCMLIPASKYLHHEGVFIRFDGSSSQTWQLFETKRCSLV